MFQAFDVFQLNLSFLSLQFLKFYLFFDSNTELLLFFFLFFFVCFGLSFSFFLFQPRLDGWVFINMFLIVVSFFRKQVSSNRVFWFSFGVFLFYFLLLANYTSLLPFGFTLTAQLLFVMFPASAIFILICFRLFLDHLIPFLVHLIPAGTPTPIKAFLFIVEVVSFFFRVVSLGTRLFANLVAGHVLLGLIASNLLGVLARFDMLFPRLGFLFVFSIWVCVYGLELLVSFLQAYVFITMLVIYFSDLGINPSRIHLRNFNVFFYLADILQDKRTEKVSAFYLPVAYERGFTYLF
jgi:F-type H+-transporting ATPase subunit a